MNNKKAIRAWQRSVIIVITLFALPAAAGEQDPLTRMYKWWATTFESPGAFTPEAFGAYFTPDAQLVIDGRVRARGLAQWAQHFQKIQATGGEVETVLPFKETFRLGNKIYTYHVIRTRRSGAVGCMLAAGHAVLENGKIALLSLVRTTLDPAAGPLDPACWTS